MDKMHHAELKAGTVMRFTHFSNHATKRLMQRTRLTRLELARVLDHRLFVHIGNEPGLPREHLLFYSTLDENSFVAVRDKLTGAVVTVLPLEYHENLAWSISPTQIAKAKKLACCSAAESAAKAMAKNRADDSASRGAPNFLAVSCSYIASPGRTIVKNLLKVPAANYQNNIRTFMHHEGTPALLDKAALEKGLDATKVVAVAVRLGKKGIPELLVLNDQVWTH